MQELCYLHRIASQGFDIAESVDHLQAPRDARKELAALFKESGGLALAYKLQSESLLKHVKILYTITEPSWTWYNHQVTTVKTPQHGFLYSMHMSEEWANEPHIVNTIRCGTSIPSALAFMGITPAQNQQSGKMAHKALMLSWHIAAKRLWSLSKHSFPPECYANIASDSPTKADKCMTLMRTDWGQLMMLEQRQYQVPAAKRLLEDLDFAASMPVRLLFCFFERDQWNVRSLAGRKFLKGLMQTLPDNKIVEDVHQVIRLEARANGNTKQICSQLQDLVTNSKVLEKRGIRHLASVTREQFVRQYKKTKADKTNKRYYCGKHKMHQQWMSIMGTKRWKANTEDSSHKTAAAWHWLQTYSSGRLAQEGIGIDRALFSKLVLPFTLLRRTNQCAFASMGNATWGALVWPLAAVSTDENEHASYTFCTSSPSQWIHITDPSEWNVIPAESVSTANGIILKQNAPQVSLIKHCLANKHTLVHSDLVMCASHLNLLATPEGNHRASRDTLLEALANHVSEGEPGFAENALKVDKMADETGNRLTHDPLSELVFEDMDPEDKTEFPEVHKALQQARVKRKVAEWQNMKHKADQDKCNKKKQRAQAKTKAKSKAKAKAKAWAKRRPRNNAVEPPAAAQHLPPADEPPEVDIVAAGQPAVGPPIAPVGNEVLAGAPVELPPADGAPVGLPPAAAQPGQRRSGALLWQDVPCASCGLIAGQIKYDPAPGNRDGPSWIMRVEDPAAPGKWPQCGHYFRTRRTSVVGELAAFATNWVTENHGCPAG